MNYQILPMGDIWSDGMLSVPKKIVTDYIKMASEYQLKAILVIMANNGTMDSPSLAKSLGLPQSDVEALLDFWVSEGVLMSDNSESGVTVAPKPPKKSDESEKKQDKKVTKAQKDEIVQGKKQFESMSMPQLSPKDIVTIGNENPEYRELLHNAESVMGKTLSQAEQGMLINMVSYYGLPPAVVLMILTYYRSEKEKGKAIGTSYVCAMAKNWAEEGIVDCKCAEEKLAEIESSDRIWNEITVMAGIRHRTPTVNQRNMISDWREDFSMEMIALACDAMKENAQKPTLKYVDKVLKNWKKKNILTPSDVENDRLSFAKAKEDKQSGDKIQGKASYDIDEIQKKAMLNDDFDI